MQVLNWHYGVRYPRSSPPMQPVVFPRGEIKVRKPTCAEVEALDDHHFHGYRRGKLVRVTLVLVGVTAYCRLALLSTGPAMGVIALAI